MGRRKSLEYAPGTALRYHPGQPTVAQCRVLPRDPAGVQAPMALLCTNPQHRPHTIVVWCLRRRQMIEVIFQAVRVYLGGGDSAPVAGPGQRLHHTRPAGLLQLGRRDRASAVAARSLPFCTVPPLRHAKTAAVPGTPPGYPPLYRLNTAATGMRP